MYKVIHLLNHSPIIHKDWRNHWMSYGEPRTRAVKLSTSFSRVVKTYLRPGTQPQRKGLSQANIQPKFCKTLKLCGDLPGTPWQNPTPSQIANKGVIFRNSTHHPIHLLCLQVSKHSRIASRRLAPRAGSSGSAANMLTSLVFSPRSRNPRRGYHGTFSCAQLVG